MMSRTVNTHCKGANNFETRTLKQYNVPIRKLNIFIKGANNYAAVEL